MRLREDTKIREKVTVHLGTWQIVLILALSVAFSGLVFGTGILVGKQDQGGMTTLQPASGKVPQKAALQTKGGLSVPQFARIPGEVFSKFGPAEMLDSFNRFLVQSHADTLAQDEQLFQQQEELLKAKARHRIRPDIYDAPDDPDPTNDIPIDMAKERLSVVDPGGQAGATPQGAPLPGKAEPKKAGPKVSQPEAEVADVTPEQAPKADKNVKAAKNVKAEKSAKADKAAGATDGSRENPVAAKKSQSDPASEGEVAGEPKSEKVKASDNAIHVYSVQLLAYKDKASAMDYVKRLESSPLCVKYKPFIMPVEVPQKGQFYRVRIGRFTSKKEAERLRLKVASQEGIDAKVVSM